MSHAILCAKCRVEVQKAEEEGKPDMAVCPKCGLTDTVENAVAEAGKALAARLADDSFKGFEAISRKPGLQIKVTRSPPKQYRFILSS